MQRSPVLAWAVMVVASLVVGVTRAAEELPVPPTTDTHLEQPGDPPAAPISTPVLKDAAVVERGGFRSVQVNVDEEGRNIVGDAANEPSIAVDPKRPNRIAIGWRQFDSIASDYREAGVAWSRDGGRSWHFEGALGDDLWRSDPVLASDSRGRFFYYSLAVVDHEWRCFLRRSDDGGRRWGGQAVAYGGDKAWIGTDPGGGPGRNNLYLMWSMTQNSWGGSRMFSRSTDRGASFSEPAELVPPPMWGTIAVGPDGELYLGGNAGFEMDTFILWRSDDAQEPLVEPTFQGFAADLGGTQLGACEGPNPRGMQGQVWVDVDRSENPSRGFVYMLASVQPFQSNDPLDVHFIRSTDRGETWSEPVAVAADSRGAWQWFGTMAVAPTGRIDVVWVESLDGLDFYDNELYYSFSDDSGYSWSSAEAITPVFDSSLGWPIQDKLGDYFHMVSDALGADLAYAATFNGEQDVYYLRIGPRDCNRNGVDDAADLRRGSSRDCNGNSIPDDCELAADPEVDADRNGVLDECVAEPRRAGGRHAP